LSARRVGRAIVTTLMAAIVAAGVGWSVLALWFDGPTPRAAAGTLAIATALGSLLLAASIRPLRRGLIAALVPVVAVGLLVEHYSCEK